MIFKKNILIFSLLMICSCLPKDKTGVTSGSNSNPDKIIFPEMDQLSHIALSDTFNVQQYYFDFLNSKSKIVVYADSLNYVECDMKFIEWKLKIKELNLRAIDTKILFILNSSYVQIVKEIIERDLFGIPVFFESDRCFSKVNNFPETIKKITFFLNDNNEIILVGNPISNETIWDQYKKSISQNRQ